MDHAVGLRPQDGFVDDDDNRTLGNKGMPTELPAGGGGSVPKISAHVTRAVSAMRMNGATTEPMAMGSPLYPSRKNARENPRRNTSQAVPACQKITAAPCTMRRERVTNTRFITDETAQAPPAPRVFDRGWWWAVLAGPECLELPTTAAIGGVGPKNDGVVEEHPSSAGEPEDGSDGDETNWGHGWLWVGTAKAPVVPLTLSLTPWALIRRTLVPGSSSTADRHASACFMHEACLGGEWTQACGSTHRVSTHAAVPASQPGPLRLRRW